MFMRGLFSGCTLSAVAAWGVYRVLLEPRSNIHVEYQESQNRVDNVNKGYSLAAPDILKYGPPRRSPEFSYYKNHVLCYDQQKRIPLWVAEHITKQHMVGEANRKRSEFKPDPSIPKMFSAQNEDYWNSGWSRGHMAPAGNNKHDQDSMSQTFYLTNIVPQDLDNNSGFWNRFEIYCRDLIKKFDHVRVITGPLFLSSEKKGRKRVKYLVLGSSEVAVPTHLFKIVIAENDNSKQGKLLGAFVVPNKPISNEHHLKEFQVPLEFIESKSGLSILPLLNRAETRDLCKEDGCHMISWEKFELKFILRKLQSAETLHRLEKVWKELSEKGIKPDKTIISIYNSKKNDLEKTEAVAVRKSG